MLANDKSARNLEYARRLRLIREYLGLKQNEIAAELNVAPNRYNHWETGNTPFPLDYALKLREMYGISLDFMYCGSFDALPHKVAKALQSMSRDNASNRSSDKGDR